MFSSIIYLISYLALITAFLLFPKSAERQNGVIWLTVSFLAYECYTAFVGGISSLVHIPVDILTMSILNFLVAGSLFFVMFRKKVASAHPATQIRQVFQNYTFKIVDVSFAVLLAVIAIYLYSVRYGGDSAIIYATVDPADRLSAAMHIITTKSVIYTYPNLYFGHINNAFFIELLNPVYPEILSFRAFEIKGMINLWMSGMLFYSALRCYSDRRFSIAVFYLLSLVYTLGYPWSNEIWGFNYLGISVSLIILVQIGSKFLLSGKINPIIAMLIIGMGCFGVGISYTLFAPPVFIAAFLAITLFVWRKVPTTLEPLPDKKSRKVRVSAEPQPNKKATFVRWIFTEFCVFVFPTVLTVVFTMMIGRNSAVAVGTQLLEEGAMFRNLFTDFLPYLPFALFCFVLTVKNRDWDFSKIFTAIFFAFQVYFFIQMINENVSAYYYYKLNYPAWFNIIFLAGLAIDAMTREKKNIACLLCYFVCWAAVAFAGLSGFDARLNAANNRSNPVAGAFVSFQIYVNNEMYFRGPSANVVNYDWDFVELCDFARGMKATTTSMYDSDIAFWTNSVEVISDRYEDAFWADALVNEHIVIELAGPGRMSQGGDTTIWIVVKNSTLYGNNKAIIDSFDRVFENDLGFIVETNPNLPQK